jgi:hypothetical protein
VRHPLTESIILSILGGALSRYVSLVRTTV